MKPILFFAFGALLALAVLYTLMPAEREPVQWWQMDNAQTEIRMSNATADEVKDYIRWNDQREWKEMDIVPAYIANAGDYRRAMAAINRKYPGFETQIEDSLLSRIRENPLDYRAYRFDVLAADRFYLKRSRN